MSDSHPVLGIWEVTAQDTPFAHHVMVFRPDGTAVQSNPDRGIRVSSDSNGRGIWRADGDRVAGAFLEYVVDRTDPALVNKGVIGFEFEVIGDRLEGSATVRFYDLAGELLRGPSTSRLTGIRFIG
ncbi:hypothetical protein [Nocardia pseudobrasiliensis]|uniref:Lipocalin-like protein n=1 Tax=Nocardia pseudobrasiliensis TaxID=45979 RepID=A0A370I328_9NOCA|nr:hypothetical protein [Nocardia pseudobrasiliensis]RDI63704.1 hypothetical protein DFR76_10940 [Nocardia pseudobrasiliensis]